MNKNLMSIDEFFSNEIPFVISADAYTISSDIFASETARDWSCYNFTNRLSPKKAFPEIADDSRMVMFGVQEFIREYLTKPITAKDVKNSAEFMKRANSFGGALPFNEDMWMTVVDKYNGYLPVSIESIPDGTTFFPNQPVIQVYSDVGYGELAAHIEALMVGKVSIAIARATICAHWKNKLLEIFKNVYKYDDSTAMNIADWFIHDFGMRASSSEEESRTLGKAHLLFFNGTDTFNAAYSAWKDSGKADVPYGTSILALAHRNVQGYFYNSHDGENNCFERLNAVAKLFGKIGSYVSDCYKFKKAVDKLAILSEKDKSNKIVSRPDSGKAKDNIKYILETELLRFIEGNTITPTSMFDILNDKEIIEKDAPKRGIFGVGGYLRNNCTRDTFSSAMKLAAIGPLMPVCKLSEDDVKMSVPGLCSITRPSNDRLISVHTRENKLEQRPDRLERLMYSSGIFYEEVLDRFNVIRDRAVKDFTSYDEFCKVNSDYGLSSDMFCNEITSFREDLKKRFRGE